MSIHDKDDRDAALKIAREETKQSQWAAARHLSTVALFWLLAVKFAPKLTDPKAIATMGVVAILVFGSAKLLKGGD